MNLFGQTNNNNYIHALKSALGEGAKFSSAEEWSGYFTNRDSYQDVTDTSAGYPFEQNHILRNDATDFRSRPNTTSVASPISVQVDYLWGTLYYNLGLTVGDPATYTVGSDTFALADASKYKLTAEGFYLIPEGAEISGDAAALADLVVMSDMRTWALTYFPDNLEAPTTFDYVVAFPFDGYYYYGRIEAAVTANASGYLFETITFKPNGQYWSQYIDSRSNATPVTPFDRDMFFTHILGDQQDVSPVSDYRFEGRRLKAPLSVFDLDHTPETITITEIPAP